MAWQMNIPDFVAAIARKTEETAFSGAVALRIGGEHVHQQACGYADMSNRVPNTLTTRFATASGTKFVTALSVGVLIDSGVLSLSSKIFDVIDADFPTYSRDITIEHLLTHTSGIPDYFDEELVDDFDNFEVAVPWHHMRGPRDYFPVFPRTSMKSDPGERFSYSNSGFILLGAAVEAVSGESFQEFATSRVLLPVGMKSSGFFAFDRLPENTANGYIKDDNGYRTNIYSLPIVGASDGGMFSTVSDIEALWDGFWNGAVITPGLVEQFAEKHVSAEPEGSRKHYGCGLWIDHQQGRRAVEYITGSDAGVSFYSVCDRGSESLFTVMSNTSEGAWPLVGLSAEFIR
jgi:CubicO group peptidase (beta-lactamase class C family)